MGVSRRAADAALEVDELCLTVGHLQYIFYIYYYGEYDTQSRVRNRGKILDIDGSEANGRG